MGRQPLARGRRIDRPAMIAEAERLFTRLGVRIDPRRPAAGLSIADQQIIEIAKAISLDARLLVMDEPTAALSGVEVDRLFAVARSLRDEGRALVFISHRFDEVFALADTVTVMRDGSYIDTRSIDETSPSELVSADGRARRRRALPQGRRRDRRAGARGARSHPHRCLPRHRPRGPRRGDRRPRRASSAPVAARSPGPCSASTPTTPARSRSPARTVRAHDPRSAIRAGMAFIPEDRRKQGLVIDSSVTPQRRRRHPSWHREGRPAHRAMENRAAGPGPRASRSRRARST